MAVTVTSDLVIRHAMDVLGTVYGQTGPTSVETAIKVQGTGSNKVGITPSAPTAVSGFGGSFTAASIRGLHILAWGKFADAVDSRQKNGTRIRVAALATNLTTNFGEWTVGGEDTFVGSIAGFNRFCIDSLRPFNFVTGTVPNVNSIAIIGMGCVYLTATEVNPSFFDSYDTATGITVAGGTVAAPGTSAEIASNDKTNGRGLFKNVGGAYYILGRVTIGDTVAANVSDFADSNEVWIFEDMFVSATFHKLEFVGTAGAGAKNAKFGIKSGTGIAAEGASGNGIKAFGLSPFRIAAIQSGITVGLFGCSFTNPAALKDDALRAYQFATAADVFTDQTREANSPPAEAASRVWQVDATPGLDFVEETTDFNSAATLDVLPFPATEDINDYFAVGSDQTFGKLRINTGTVGSNGVLAKEYWNGTSWVALANVTDGTSNFTTAGLQTITFTVPSDWAKTSLNSTEQLFYVRFRITTIYSTNPVITQGFLGEAGTGTISDFSFMPGTEAVGDKAVFGHEEPFSQLKINVGTAGVGGAVAWEYWNGTTWAALTSLTDGTSGFTVAGTNLVTYAIPDDWATTTLGGLGPYYYIRARVTTVYSPNPLGTQAFCVMGGRVRLEQANAEAIRCTFTNMDTIKVRSGAFLKKSTITDSVAPPKSAALDLGAADPATDTVRDLTIQNSARGILLNPTATATYNFRAIKFSNNAVVSAAIQEDASPAGFVNLTTAANDSTANDVGFFPVTPAVSDAFYIGYHSQFDKAEINVGTAGAGTYTVTWQYWNSTWVALAGVTDGTTAFKTAGTNLLTFTQPSNWVKNTVNSQGPFFYIRALRDGGTETTRPLGTQLRAGFDVRVDAPGASTVTINVLESGTTPVVDNVNNSTIVINNAVNLTITVKDKNTVAIQNAQTAIYRTDNNLELMNADTDVNGVATTSFNFITDTAIYIRVRKSSTPDTKYTPVSTTGTITSSGFSLLVTLAQDDIVT